MGAVQPGASNKDVQRLGRYAESAVLPTHIVTIGMRDGVEIAAVIRSDLDRFARPIKEEGIQPQ